MIVTLTIDYFVMVKAGAATEKIHDDPVRVLRGIRLERKNTNFGKTLIPGDKTDHVDSEAAVVVAFHYHANASPHFCCASLHHNNISNS